MRKLFASSLLVAALGAAGASMPAGASTIESRLYVAPVGDATILCPETLGAPVTHGIGGNCFALAAADDRLVVVIDDMLVSHVGFQLGFYTSSGGRLGAFRTGCDNGAFAIPDGAVQARVFIDGPVNGPTDCGSEGPLDGVGVVGLIGVVRLP